MGCLRSLVRRKQFDSSNGKAETHHHHQQLAKALTFPHLIAIGVGSTIGAGVYILVGTVAREHSGPALALSFLIAGISAALSAFCYAELSSRFPSAGSAYHYSYICIGEGVAWLIGWALILEYTIGGSTVARGISPNLAMIFGGEDCLPTILARHQIPGLDIVVDPCAAVLVFIVTGLCCLGVKESTFAQGIVTTANVFVMIFVIVAGSYLCFKTGWVGYELPTGYFPYGVDGMLTGSATVFFAYIGFDTVASMAEEVKNPRRDLPLGIGISLLLCCLLYMMVSVVIVGLVPYYAMDPDTPISSAFSSHGIQWAAYLINLGAVMALCSALMGSILPQPRILMAMARDGLLPSYFSYVNQRTQVPINGTITTGVCAAILAFFMDVSQLAGMVSVGTLVAFTMVAISLLIVRYVVPPDEVPLPSSLQENSSSHVGTSIRSKQPLLGKVDDSVVDKENAPGSWVLNKKNRRKFAGWSIMFTCIGNFLLSYAASSFLLPGLLRYSLCGVGGLFLLVGLIVLICIDQDDARHSFGHSGGFICPFVPLLPIVCILINMYLLVNLGAATWVRVSVWLFLGVVVYIFYGRRNSSLVNAVYVSTAHLQEIRRTSGHSLA
ncbi:cationic amino acid transporter 3 [Arabidopsis thaliana]|uniref:Cationic amino acid transporter 3, mitochondrial n=1 Tax=Arabidopsis thaliana TaxID=3702 RepID=CAAT3_ARATH|nr:cationic amino acid transporter 3 [Arabidopsis thaliana]Q8GYB4.1 RecName: Full=Cationic amino acid transporter 3, mitochondrial; Flags: Precursor [Arabidopsis thaliana]AED94130.1 cationic amino acid transporter 3 [Arabidopsis thaliana]BAC42395.1 putative cationic amino acid transporter [Arabidopsis thaliana]|eukprot:NP_198510.2 cationic amino acid transporter 3 [Arabidopsis thaliana]